MDDKFDDIQDLETPESVDSNPEELYDDVSGGYSQEMPMEDESIPQSQPIKNTVDNIRNNNKSSKESKAEKIANSEKKKANADKAASNAAKMASKGTKTASNVAKATAKGVEAGTNAAAGALSAIPVVGGALGAGVKGAGTAVSKTAEATGNALDAASKVSDKASKKLADSSKKHAAKAAGAQAKDAPKKVANTAKKTVETVKKVVETFKNPVKRWIIIGVSALLLLIIVVAAILEPLTNAMDKVKNGADAAEKLNNFMHGMGFENSKDAFYDELEFLEKHYGNSLNEPLLMATLFYDDVFGSGSIEEIESNVTDESDLKSFATTYQSLVNYAAKETFTEEDANGLVYSTNKILRLKKLTKHMTQKDGVTNTLPLSDYIGLSLSTVNSDGGQLMESYISVICYDYLSKLDMLATIAQIPFTEFVMNPGYVNAMRYLDESGYLSTHSANDALFNTFDNLVITLDDLTNIFTDITGINIQITYNGVVIFDHDIGDTIEADDETIDTSVEGSGFAININVSYSGFQLDEDSYFEYLKTDYIPNMPEFKNIVHDKDGNVIDSKVNGIIDDIKLLAATWEEIYGDPNGTGESNVCIGNIHPNLLNQFSTPVPLETGAEVNFSTDTAFGITKNGSMHYGVDLNEDSVGVGVGTPVRAIYNGTIVASTTSGDFTDFDAGTGGCIKISHDMTYTNDEDENTSVTLYSYYCGLDPVSMSSMTTGTAVSKESQLGYIGDATYSEDGKTPGLHFAIFSEGKGAYMNPINVFITCYSDYSPNGGYGDYEITSTSCLKVHGMPITFDQFKEGVDAAKAEYPILGTWDLETVYKEAGKNNINPELLVIRAISEGFSPYTSNHNNYNYWGLGCGNNTGVCEHYSSMAAGIAGFASAQSVKNAKTLEEMMSSYAYIGRNWYTRTQGASNYWSDGGCPYFSYIKKYMPSERATEVARYCNNPLYSCINDSTPTCLPTIQVDQKAYTMYNIQDMNDNWVKYFGQFHDTDSENCDTEVSGGGGGSGGSTLPPGIGGGSGQNASEILDIPLDEFLESKGSSITEFNNAISDVRAQNGGFCKGKNVTVAIAQKTINFMAAKGKRLPYYLGGGHGDYPGYSDLMGVKDRWGRQACTKSSGAYTACGLDCTGWVRWILANSGYKIGWMCVGSKCGGVTDSQSSVSSFFPGATYAGKISTLSANERLEPGDLLFSSGHMIFITGVDSTGYNCAEAKGLDYGIMFSHVDFTSGYYGIRMHGYYANPSNCILYD